MVGKKRERKRWARREEDQKRGGPGWEGKGQSGHGGPEGRRRARRGDIRREDQGRTGYNLGSNSEEAMLNFSIQLNPITPIRMHLGHKAECYNLF